MKTYPLQLEISGPIALWARPDTLPNPVSYVAPTFSACLKNRSSGRESALISRKTEGRVSRLTSAATKHWVFQTGSNYGGPLRKSGQIKNGTSLQIFAQVLINVCYRLHAEADWNRGPHNARAESPDGTCSPHKYQDAFNRRLENGQWFYQPCLGWKEFVPDYVGPFRAGTAPCANENHVIPAFLERMFDQPHSMCAN